MRKLSVFMNTKKICSANFILIFGYKFIPAEFICARTFKIINLLLLGYDVGFEYDIEVALKMKFLIEHR